MGGNISMGNRQRDIKEGRMHAEFMGNWEIPNLIAEKVRERSLSIKTQFSEELNYVILLLAENC